MSQGWLPSTRNRLEGRIPVRIPLQMLPGRIQGVSPGEFGIHYRPRVSIKGQVLADFI
ncbi:hypothetical protein Tco_0358388, partial [Tanacetum coccineum]